MVRAASVAAVDAQQGHSSIFPVRRAAANLCVQSTVVAIKALLELINCRALNPDKTCRCRKCKCDEPTRGSKCEMFPRGRIDVVERFS